MSLMVDPATVASAAKGAGRRPREAKESYKVNWTTTILLAVAGLTVIIPLYFAVAMSLKTAAEAASGTGFILRSS